MMNYFKKYVFFLGFLGFFGINSAHATDVSLYLLYNGTNKGEQNQVLGVAGALTKKVSSVNQEEFDLQNAQQKDTFLKTVQGAQSPCVIVAAGESVIPVLRQVSSENHPIISYSSHQYTPAQQQLKDVATLIVLPAHTVTPEVEKDLTGGRATLLKTTGVPHNLSPEKVREIYQQYATRIPHAPTYVGVILGGDAPTPDGVMHYYTAEEAGLLATYVAGTYQGKHLLILNGPRTGKHNQQTGQELQQAHKNGQGDFVTAAFIQQLQEIGLQEGQGFTLFDFQFGDTTPYYQIVLGALAEKGGILYVAGESTSMVSESADCLPAGSVIAYRNGAMNENHEKHLKSEQSAGRVGVLTYEREKGWLLDAAQATGTHNPSAASVVAEEIAQRLRQ